MNQRLRIFRTDSWTLEGMDPGFASEVQRFEVPGDRPHLRRFDVPEPDWFIMVLRWPQILDWVDHDPVWITGEPGPQLESYAGNCWVETQEIRS